MAHRSIRTAEEMDALFTLLGDLKLPVTVEWTQGADRSAQQNRLMWKWAGEVEEQMQQETADEIQRQWKLDHGLPILCADSQEYRDFCRLTLASLNREQRIKAMRFTPVTSEMNVRQMVKFMDAVERECLEQGVVLTQPEPELRAYHDRYREKRAA